MQNDERQLITGALDALGRACESQAAAMHALHHDFMMLSTMALLLALLLGVVGIFGGFFWGRWDADQRRRKVVSSAGNDAAGS